jgi:hypothetical protein
MSKYKKQSSISETNKITNSVNTRTTNDDGKRKCVKCGVELPENVSNKRCDDCNIKRNKLYGVGLKLEFILLAVSLQGIRLVKQ